MLFETCFILKQSKQSQLELWPVKVIVINEAILGLLYPSWPFMRGHVSSMFHSGVKLIQQDMKAVVKEQEWR